jgi:branched-chain amino acid transport system substrate-binding protein
LIQAGDNLTRENIIKISTSLNNYQIPIVLPGVIASTSASDFTLFQTIQLVKFDGARWVNYGKPITVQ